MRKVWNLIFSVLLCFYATDAARCEVDSVMEAVCSLPHDTVRLSELKKWVDTTRDTPDELLYLDALLSESIYQENIEYQSFSYRNKIRYYYNTNDLERAEAEAGPSIAFLCKNKLYSTYFDVAGMIAILYTNHGMYEFSIQKGNDMYREAMALKNKEGIAFACYSLAYAYYASGCYREALIWNRKGLEQIRSSGKLQNLMELYFLSAECSLSLSKMDDLGSYLDSVRMQLNECRKCEVGSAKKYAHYWLWLNCRYAFLCLQKDCPEKARIYLNEASIHIDDHSYDIYQDLYHFTWSDYYLAVNEYEKALEEVERGGAALAEPDLATKAEILKKCARIYDKKNDFRSAAENIQECVQISDSLDKIRLADQSGQLRTLYNVNRLETEGEEQISIIRIQIVLALFLCITICLLCFFFYRFLRIRRKAAIAVSNAQAADQNTSLFLNNMGRSVKMFLEEISALSDLLIQTEDPEKRREYAATIYARNNRAQRVIFDILDVSKIESGRIRFHYEKIDLREFVETLIFTMRDRMPEHVKIVQDRSDDFLLSADSYRLQQVLTNLLGYAVAHTDKGCLGLGYEIIGRSVLFYISGENWRMSDHDYDVLFDRISQTSGKLEEMSLEMVVGKGLVQAMGGVLIISPGSGGGTRIEFSIPDRSYQMADK